MTWRLIPAYCFALALVGYEGDANIWDRRTPGTPLLRRARCRGCLLRQHVRKNRAGLAAHGVVFAACSMDRSF